MGKSRQEKQEKDAPVQSSESVAVCLNDPTGSISVQNPRDNCEDQIDQKDDQTSRQCPAFSGLSHTDVAIQQHKKPYSERFDTVKFMV